MPPLTVESSSMVILAWNDADCISEAFKILQYRQQTSVLILWRSHLLPEAIQVILSSALDLLSGLTSLSVSHDKVWPLLICQQPSCPYFRSVVLLYVGLRVPAHTY